MQKLYLLGLALQQKKKKGAETLVKKMSKISIISLQAVQACAFVCVSSFIWTPCQASNLWCFHLIQDTWTPDNEELKKITNLVLLV